MGKFIVAVLAIVYILLVAFIGALPAFFWENSFKSYIGIVAILIALQLFFGKLWNYFVDRNFRLEMQQVEAVNKMAEAFQQISIVCEYCGTVGLANVLIGKNDNTYVCPACNQTNAVKVAITTARITQPIMPKVEVANIFKNIDKNNKE